MIYSGISKESYYDLQILKSKLISLNLLNILQNQRIFLTLSTVFLDTK